ncbi:hypothetical protein ACTHAL_000796 [Priestia flexa]|uniref:hypothetical protein n=1 Tax=Bacillaceae TaxID=186817 RepID=UPI000AD7E592|nr:MULTISPECIES: hypothetical protein [Bacillaceae]
MEEFKDLLSYGILMRPTSYSKLKLAIEGVASGKCGFTTLRKSKYKKSNFSVL